jgi:hypothetical protein
MNAALLCTCSDCFVLRAAIPISFSCKAARIKTGKAALALRPEKANPVKAVSSPSHPNRWKTRRRSVETAVV